METPAEGFDTSGVRRPSQERSREVEQRLEPCSASWLRRMPSPRDSIRSRSVLIGGATERSTPTRRPTPQRTAHPMRKALQGCARRLDHEMLHSLFKVDSRAQLYELR
ncbi:hypothetical protein L1887_59642 [Cichorium endivia]|nr:hypothetical protein L1887_59642 [Cichorium endivia]